MSGQTESRDGLYDERGEYGRRGSAVYHSLVELIDDHPYDRNPGHCAICSTTQRATGHGVTWSRLLAEEGPHTPVGYAHLAASDVEWEAGHRQVPVDRLAISRIDAAACTAGAAAESRYRTHTVHEESCRCDPCVNGLPPINDCQCTTCQARVAAREARARVLLAGAPGHHGADCHCQRCVELMRRAGLDAEMRTIYGDHRPGCSCASCVRRRRQEVRRGYGAGPNHLDDTETTGVDDDHYAPLGVGFMQIMTPANNYDRSYQHLRREAVNEFLGNGYNSAAYEEWINSWRAAATPPFSNGRFTVGPPPEVQAARLPELPPDWTSAVTAPSWGPFGICDTTPPLSGQPVPDADWTDVGAITENLTTYCAADVELSGVVHRPEPDADTRSQAILAYARGEITMAQYHELMGLFDVNEPDPEA